MQPIEQHQIEIQRNLAFWKKKPVLRQLYSQFYARIARHLDPHASGQVLEIGSGIGNLKEQLPAAMASDLFPNPWLDLVCDGYELPFADDTLGAIILFDVFHHLEAPWAFLREARRALRASGRVIIFDPFISWASYPAYGLFHHEPVGLKLAISTETELSRPRNYYAAQGNATRLFFGKGGPILPEGWRIVAKEAFASFAYLLSGGFSKPAFYPEAGAACVQSLDRLLTKFPRLFGARCLVVLSFNK